jgi:hypothetical protein
MSIPALTVQLDSNEQVRDSVRNVIRVAYEHLVELNKQSDLIHKRILLLKKVVAGLGILETMHSSHAATHELTTSPSTTRVATSLRRACRTALMEANDPESVEQLIHRIRKRDSYKFPSAANPSKLVTRQLNLMLSHGEVSRHATEEGCAWQLLKFAGLKTSNDPDRPVPGDALPLQP